MVVFSGAVPQPDGPARANQLAHSITPVVGGLATARSARRTREERRGDDV